MIRILRTSYPSISACVEASLMEITGMIDNQQNHVLI